MALTECQKASTGLKVFAYTISGEEHRVFEHSKRRAHEQIFRHCFLEARKRGLLNKSVPDVMLLFDKPQAVPQRKLKRIHGRAKSETEKMFKKFMDSGQENKKIENEFHHFNNGGVILSSTWIYLLNNYGSR